MEHYHIYHSDVPAFLDAMAQAPAVQRLRRIGMNCGCEYTAFPLFRRLRPYSRYDHSLGVALIVWHFTQDRVQAAAGLLHDAATPVFAHVVDFMNGDYLKQESTEARTADIILRSPELLELLRQNGIAPAEVCDYHRYPIADNDAPRLSADRLEYTLGNMLNYGFCSADTVQRLYGDLVVGKNEDGCEELMFRSVRAAEVFALTALKCSRVYVSDEDRYSMQILSELLRSALDRGILAPRDLYASEPEVIEKLLGDPEAAAQWREFRALCGTLSSAVRPSDGKWRRIAAKKRCVDPMVEGKGRISGLSAAFGEELDAFLHAQQDRWICGVTE